MATRLKRCKQIAKVMVKYVFGIILDQMYPEVSRPDFLRKKVSTKFELSASQGFIRVDCRPPCTYRLEVKGPFFQESYEEHYGVSTKDCSAAI